MGRTMENIEEILLNRFDMTKWQTGFVDHFSNMAVSVNRCRLGLMEICPRGLIEWRQPMTEELCTVRVRSSGSCGRKLPVYLYKTDFLPWVVRQEGLCLDEKGHKLLFYTALCSPAIDRLVWKIDMMNEGTSEHEFCLELDGSMLEIAKRHVIEEIQQGVKCVFNPETKVSKYLAFPQLDGMQPAWCIRSAMTDSIKVNEAIALFSLTLRAVRLKPKEKTSLLIQFDYGTVGIEDARMWYPEKLYTMQDLEGVIADRKRHWIRNIGNASRGDGDLIKKARSAAGLLRCGCKWKGLEGEGDVIASYCSITNWSSTAFFWDSLIAALGLGQFNIKLAQDAIKSIYLRQREDGCVPTHSYAHANGSTFYPQAPITAWSMLRLVKSGLEESFIREMLPKIDALHQWFMKTQDHDGDGLPEWRFTGCPADNSPLFDHYARPINKDLSLQWNIYIPPVASVSLCSFLIMDAKCMARLYHQIGNTARGSFYLSHAAELEKKLKKICFKDGEMFYDYDHHTGQYNQALTLYSFLPLWAGIEMDDATRKNMIENVLLNKDIFFGEFPFPYLAYDEESYKPDGYWRGRIWPHTVIWILELLCANGYEEYANIAVERLLKMMDQKEEILENYYSSPFMHGGGELDYNWSFASYLVLENKVYKEDL